MTNPTKEELDRWREDRENRRIANVWAQDDIPEPVRALCQDIDAVVRFLAWEGDLTRPNGAMFRIVRRLGQSVCPQHSRSEQRRYGLLIIRRIVPRRTTTPMFRISVTKQWKKLRERKEREYQERCLESGFIMRVHELSRPGGVSDRIELFQQGKLPRFSVERDLALTDPGRMFVTDALEQAAKEAAEQANKWFGRVPKRWRCDVDQNSLSRRYQRLLQRYIDQGYFDLEGGMLQEPKVGISALKRRPGRPPGK